MNTNDIRPCSLILGIDPGSIITGYGLVGETLSGDLKCVTYGVLGSKPGLPLADRLLKIGEGLREIFETYAPYAVSLEKTFFAKNVDSATKLGQARGVCLYEASRAKVQVHEYNPTEVKLNIVGHGRAGKDQVQFLVRTLLKLPPMEKFDMSDALALAIHHCRVSGTQQRMKDLEL